MKLKLMKFSPEVVDFPALTPMSFECKSCGSDEVELCNVWVDTKSLMIMGDFMKRGSSINMNQYVSADPNAVTVLEGYCRKCKDYRNIIVENLENETEFLE